LHDACLLGIPMSTIGSPYGLPTRYASGPPACQRGSRPCGVSDSGVKSVHFNTVHNCQQLSVTDARETQLSDVHDAPGMTTSASVGQKSLPASYRYNILPTESQCSPAMSTPTATISRHYAVQPRTFYKPRLDPQTTTAATLCRQDDSCGHALIANGLPSHSLSPQCTISDDGCTLSTTGSRLRHYCV